MEVISKIRKLNENDYEKYLKLINNLRPTQFSKKDFLNILEKINNNSSIWVMELDNELISTGTILYEHKFIHNISKLAHIEDICVDEKYRGMKYGEKLINYLVEEAKKNDCYKVNLYCDEKLEKFYEKSSFQKKGIQMAVYFE